ncbi:hypothetical protein LAZ67_16002096 [Cordylochernes scorpioides]|uniref:Reverse transcriptase domain-containing protein n=1 Tax=Cordylochernes scorpioides TaxID=51811 RepID=A0ABY6LBQ3_9ARAC|nr:hypothetical protein LAZ67_16002096 [Cordylochernes scorpioides]
MENILRGEKEVICYLNDILIFATTKEEHDEIMRSVLRKMATEEKLTSGGGTEPCLEACKDKQTGLRFLVDSDDDVSLIPTKSEDKKQAELKLNAANGTKIDTHDLVFPYIDDILIVSTNKEEHETHLDMIFERLSKHGLRIKANKSKFGVQEVEFLRHLITKEGSRSLPSKTKAIQEYKLPETIQYLRAFLGMLNFYRRYLKDAAETQAVLHEFLEGARKKKDKRKISWTTEAKSMFEKCKQNQSNVAMLTYPNAELPLSLSTDASNWAVGAVLQQY